jgi:hypothetical protein
MSNLRLSDLPAAPDETVCRRPLTFDPLPTTTKDNNTEVAATNDEAELMRWHYHLSHLSFPKLKQLALYSEIPK